MTKTRIRLFDTHCHMDMEAFSGDLTREFQYAREAGVEKFVVPACGVFNWDRVLEIGESYSGVYYALGLHPHFVDRHRESHIDMLGERLRTRSNRCVAVGECGLDFYLSRDGEQWQTWLLTEQIKLANRYDLPLILHCRKAHQDMIKLLRQQKACNGGVIHGFTGSYQQAMDFINLGFYIGVGGSITYPRANKTRHTISCLPLDSLVLETDAPDMPVFGRQGEKNHPKNIQFILNELNVLRSESEQTIADKLFQNSRALFRIC